MRSYWQSQLDFDLYVKLSYSAVLTSVPAAIVAWISGPIVSCSTFSRMRMTTLPPQSIMPSTGGFYFSSGPGPRALLLTSREIKSYRRYHGGMRRKRNSDGRKLDHHTLQVIRQQAIKAVREGQTATSVAGAFGRNVRTVFTWLAKFSDGGEEALLAKPIPGRPLRAAMRKSGGSHKR